MQYPQGNLNAKAQRRKEIQMDFHNKIIQKNMNKAGKDVVNVKAFALLCIFVPLR